MKHFSLMVLSAILAFGLVVDEIDARGPRGGGGGGGASRPTPSRSPSSTRPSSPSRPSGGGLTPSQSPGFSRPSSPSSHPGTPSSRPSSPSSRPGNPSSRPGGTSPATRPANPSLTPGNRPNIAPGQRPGIGQLPSSRPIPGVPPQGSGQLPGQRPGQLPNERPGTLPGSRPGQRPNERPTFGQGNGPGQRPNERPGTLPGFSQNDRVSDRRDVRGDRLSNRQETTLNRQENRATTLEGRRDGFQDRLDSRQDSRTERSENRQDSRTDRVDLRQDGRSDRLDSRQDFRQDARQDWQNYHDRHNWHHYGWHHGHHYYPGIRGDYWKHMFGNYPVASTLHWTRRIVNRSAWRLGYWGYSNPYYAGGSSYATSGGESYSYEEPLIVESPPEQPAEETAVASNTSAGEVEYPPGVTKKGMDLFDEARNAFYAGDWELALTKVTATLQEMPRDAVVHEFRSLVLFSLGRYDESAEAIYAVLAVGPGWDWTTLSSLYGSVDDYTKQLRALEDFAKSNPKSSSAQFLLAYHYATAGHDEDAAKQFRLVLELTPNNEVALDQLSQFEGPQAIEKYTKLPDSATDQTESPTVDENAIIGTWVAVSGSSKFEMGIQKDGRFLWKFSIDGKEQEAAGVYVLDGNVLAVELDTGDTLAAEVTITDSQSLDFKLISYRADEQPMKFSKR
ncbi:Tetratricopeptide repeat protein [Thalassoglobus neptunius]|uniref:Tetratricopeptide repeat protein n=1 Tax=Thalassoglobus neptunius TaxID=1938619 RepID=A0A5C5VAK8_9PLAN|nr:tetratricopeptide repeat protein [Thalassoglobus neptunius]TWT34967.1 Tetratricopeptide repeat protein [Thalassoglobus neptunius]